jgi:hypothetical protein
MSLALQLISVIASAVSVFAMVHALRAVQRSMSVPAEKLQTRDEVLANITPDSEPIPAGWTRVHVEWSWKSMLIINDRTMKSRQAKTRREKSPQSAGNAVAGKETTSLRDYRVSYEGGSLMTIEEAVKRGILTIVGGRGTSSFRPLLRGDYQFRLREELSRR